MRHAFNGQLLKQGQQRFYVDFGRCEQHVHKRSAQLRNHIIQVIACLLQQKLAYQGEAVAVNAAGG
ncbi:hypothetical protein D3C80_1963460 [compost metagenome]